MCYILLLFSGWYNCGSDTSIECCEKHEPEFAKHSEYCKEFTEFKSTTHPIIF